MCFLRKTNKKIDELQKEVLNLKKIIETNELDRLKRNNEEFRLQQDLIKNIKLKVKRAVVAEDQDSDEKKLVITFECPTITLHYGEDGFVEKNDIFYAINYLGLLSLEDTIKLSNLLNK